MKFYMLFPMLLVLTSCGLTSYVRPDTPIPARWNAKAEMGASLADRPWGEIFPVPELAALIDEALVANSDLRIAAERVELARAQFGIERAAIFPSLVLGVSGSRGRLPGSGPIRNEISEYGDASVVIPAWEIDLWGKLRDRAETRRREMLSSEALVNAARISLVAQVSTLYLELLDFDNQVEITGRTIKTRQYALRLNRLRYDEGVAAIIDVYEAESSLASAEQVLADLIRRRAQLENALSVLLGRNPGPIIRTARLDALHPPAGALAGLPSNLLQRRPDIRAAEELLLGAEANIDAARKAFLPSLSLTTMLGYVSPLLKQLFDSDRYAWSVQPAVSVSVFDAGRLGFGVDAAEAQKRILVEQYKASIRQAFRETNDALIAMEQLAVQRTANEKTKTANAARLRAAQARYFSGVASYFEVLDAERQLLDSEIALSQTLRNQQLAVVSLYRSLGGGWRQDNDG